MKNKITFLLFLLPLVLCQANEYAMGPLAGKNLYLPHLGSFSFSATSASFQEKEARYLQYQVYYVNEFTTYPVVIDNNGEIVENGTDYRALDYESAVGELSFYFPLNSRFSTEVTFRIISYFSGKTDILIDSFHEFFSFPDAGRRFFPQDDLYIYLDCEEYTQALTKALVSPGDSDLVLNYLIYDNNRFSLASSAAVKLPTGNYLSFSGSGIPDLGVLLKADFQLFSEMSLYLQSGGVFPLNNFSSREVQLKPQLQEILALEWHPSRRISLVGQINVMSSPVTGKENYTHPVFTQTPVFSLFQTNLKMGLNFREKTGTWQFYFEEDPLTYAGADILVSLSRRVSF